MESIIKISSKPPEFETKWISEGIDENCVKYLENMGFYLCDRKSLPNPTLKYDPPGGDAVTTSQLRNVFEEVKRVQLIVEQSNSKDIPSDVLSDILLLRPKIAYNAARIKAKRSTSRIDAFRKFAETALLEVTQNDDKEKREKYKRFCQLMEGIIAYHKVYGGKD
jgi:CRISPR-associated protein Csm2